MENGVSDKKVLMILSYLFPIIGIIMPFADKQLSSGEKFQFLQSFVLPLSVSILSAITVITIVGPFILLIAHAVFVIMAIVKLNQGLDYKVPGIGNLTEKIFGNVINQQG